MRVRAKPIGAKSRTILRPVSLPWYFIYIRYIPEEKVKRTDRRHSDVYKYDYIYIYLYVYAYTYIVYTNYVRELIEYPVSIN